MRPLIAKQHVFVRQLAKTSPALVCLDRNSGQPKWVYQGPADEWLVSDPFAARGQLFALTMQTGDASADLLELTRFDIDERFGERAPGVVESVDLGARQLEEGARSDEVDWGFS